MATKWKCQGECEREFGIGEWECAPGVKHVVARKEYFMADAPYDPTGVAYKHSRTTITNIPPERTMVDAQTGQPTRLVGGSVTFCGGYYSTDDPEIQFYLDRQKIDVGKARWEAAYLTVEDKTKKKELELGSRERELKRREEEVNTLLDQVRADKGVPKKKEGTIAVSSRG